MIDLHTHTCLSDGVLLPTELVRRFEAKGYTGLAVCDHVDAGTIDLVLPALVKTCKSLRGIVDLEAMPGVELTHVRPEQMALLTKRARELGAKIVLAHGETIVEPVLPGTNRSAIEAGVDVLAHPGLISKEDVKLAKERGVALEISSRKGHCLTNGHIARAAQEMGVQLVFGSDTHSPEDILTRDEVEAVIRGAGLSVESARKMLRHAHAMLKQKL